MRELRIVDCTFRDGGYYNNWDFPVALVNQYLMAMKSAEVDYVELGFRSFDFFGAFKGACAFTTDYYLGELIIPEGLNLGVMVNAAELLSHSDGPLAAAKIMFSPAAESHISLVRFACHYDEFEAILPVCRLVKDFGYTIAVNLMQIADRSESEIENISRLADNSSVDALYFADSLGGMLPDQVSEVVSILRRFWHGELGIHTHDNMGHAIANTMRAVTEGVTWLDCTVTGMGRGPGNAQTEYLIFELERFFPKVRNIAPLMDLVRNVFSPMQARYGWGKNPYYYLSGLYGIHPTYIQEMLGDPRYEDADILSVIEYLRQVGGKKFSVSLMEEGRQLRGGKAKGGWRPETVIHGRDVLILGAGQGVNLHSAAVKRFIREKSPYVIALNTQTTVEDDLIDVRAACHPFRMLADCEKYCNLPQPLIVPFSNLPSVIREALDGLSILNFGFTVEAGSFDFFETGAVIPSSLVIAYALAVATSGKAKRVLLAGFDGYASEDPRMAEMDALFSLYQASPNTVPLLAITPTRYKVPTASVYGM